MPAGALVMAVGIAPAAIDTVAAQVASRLVVGAGEGLMMAAAVLWLLRLAGEQRRGRALGHIGLANYGGLAAGPLIADALGSYGAVLAAAAVLPAPRHAPDARRARRPRGRRAIRVRVSSRPRCGPGSG